jgi:hypothetical protein
MPSSEGVPALPDERVTMVFIAAVTMGYLYVV